MSRSIAERLAAAGVDANRAKEAETAVTSASAGGTEGRYWDHKTEAADFVGTVISRWTKTGFGGQGLDHCIAIQTDTEVVKIATGLQVWTKAVLAADPKVGDVVVLTSSDGKVKPAGGGYAYYDVRLQVVQRANAADLGEAPF